MNSSRHEELIRTTDARVRVMVLGPRSSVAWHSHSAVTDNMFCLEGEIRVDLGDPVRSVVLRPGERCEVDAGTVHRVVNPLDSESRYLLVQGVGPYDFIEQESP